MLLSFPRSRFKLFTTAGLLALCALALLYHVLHDRFVFRGTIEDPLLPAVVTPSAIPAKIWYKLGPNGMNEKTREWTSSCIKLNPNYQVHFMTDEEADDYVAKTFTSRPDIVDTYLGLRIPILKADILRYLLLLDQGGIWSDLDVSCDGVPIDEWVPQEYKNSASVVVGWEFDVGWPGKFVRQFASWTILSKPGVRHINKIIEDILEALKEKMKENHVSLPDLTFSMIGDVVDLTGPRRMTGSILKSLEQKLNRTIPMEEISEIVEPLLVGDVLILPGYAFALGSNKYGDKKIGPPFITHHYAGSWKNDHGGEGGQ